MTNTASDPNSQVHLLDHPLVQHKLTLMRKKDASTNSFRRLLNELSMLMAYEVTRDMATQDVEIETPLEKMMPRRLSSAVQAWPPRNPPRARPTEANAASTMSQRTIE